MALRKETTQFLTSCVDKEIYRTAQGEPTGLGMGEHSTVNAIDSLQKAELDGHTPEVPAHVTSTKQLSGFFTQPEENSRGLYTDIEIGTISTLLKICTPRWSRIPCTYIILRTIGHLDLIERLLDAGFSDYWFPVTERQLPSCLSPSVRAAFVKSQHLVLTKSIDLEKGPKGKHCHCVEREPIPLEACQILGRGGFEQVERVRSLISSKEYAMKRVLRHITFRGRGKEEAKMFINETEILKGLRHHHIVEFIGSYTDYKHIGLMMSPIADMDLTAYLSTITTGKHNELRTFFGCLVIALSFLHENKVRHKDIKPGNILINHGTVLFTDFGLSLDFADAKRQHNHQHGQRKDAEILRSRGRLYGAPQHSILHIQSGCRFHGDDFCSEGQTLAVSVRFSPGAWNSPTIHPHKPGSFSETRSGTSRNRRAL